MKTASATTRYAELRDLDQISEIEVESFGDPWSRDAFASSLDHEHVRMIVLTEIGMKRTEWITGYGIIVMLGIEAELVNIAVKRASRGRGLGGEILDSLMALAKEESVMTMYLEVRESNDAARRLYASRGFAEIGRRKKYYDRPKEDALVMRRDFDTS